MSRQIRAIDRKHPSKGPVVVLLSVLNSEPDFGGSGHDIKLLRNPYRSYETSIATKPATSRGRVGTDDKMIVRSKKSSLHVARRRSGIWQLLPILAFAAGALLWLGWQFWALHVEMEHVRSRDLRLVVLAGEIIHLDEVLTMSARIAAHFRIRRMMRGSPIRCSTKRISQSWLTVSKNDWISASSMKFTFLLLIPTQSASSAS